MTHSILSTSAPARFWDVRHNRAARNVAAIRDEVLAGFQLTSSEWFVLDIVYAARKDGISVGAVAKHMDVQTTYIALVLRHLQTKRLATTTASDQDRRVRFVTLTKDGESLLKRSSSALEDSFAAVTKAARVKDLAGYDNVVETLSVLSRK